MVLKRNLPFVAGLAIIAVLFVVVLVWLLGQVSALAKIKSDIKAKRTALEEVERKVPTKEHLAAIKQEYEKAAAAYTALKEQLLAWWDKDVYDEEKSSRQPGLFLGSLQELRRQIIKFADKQHVLLGTGVENLGFPEVAAGTPPAEVTFDMLKQRSIVRDVFMLLLNSKVESIDAVNWIGPESGGKLYSKYSLSVVFTCKYPSLAKFQTDLVNKAKVPVDIYGDFPRNFLVVDQLSYQTQDLKVASLEEAARSSAATAPATAGTTTTTTARRNPATGTARSTTGNLDHLRPDIRERILAREALLRGRRQYPGEGVRRPDSTSTTRDVARAREEEKPTVGREPNYNILTVTMTIAMVDFNEQVTGKIPALEEEKRKPRTTERPTTTTSESPPR
jgi:hypothetical protein